MHGRKYLRILNRKYQTASSERPVPPLPPMAAPPPVLTLAVEKGPREGETRQCRAGAALRVGRVVTGNDLVVRDVGASQRHLAKIGRAHV